MMLGVEATTTTNANDARRGIAARTGADRRARWPGRPSCSRRKGGRGVGAEAVPSGHAPCHRPRPLVTGFAFEALRRHPDLEGPSLVAVDASDRLALDEAAEALAAAPPGTVAVVGDRYGALTLGAVALHGAHDVRTHQDRLTGERALKGNADRLGLAGTFTSGPLDRTLEGARVVLMQLPQSLDALDEMAEAIAQHADASVQVFAAGRVKHMTLAMNEVLGRYFGSVRAGLARQKSRVLSASDPRPGGGRPAVVRPVRQEHPDLGLVVCAHGGVFAGTGIDIGTRFLVQHLPQAPSAETVLDLGCGTGVLAVGIARAQPQARVLATDASAAAVASARATAVANGVADRVTVTRDDDASSTPDVSVDLVLLNPPFHTGTSLAPGIAERLFADAARVLRPGGELWVVWNTHLSYRPTLERVVGPTRQVARNPKFTVTASRRR